MHLLEHLSEYISNVEHEMTSQLYTSHICVNTLGISRIWQANIDWSSYPLYSMKFDTLATWSNLPCSLSPFHTSEVVQNRGVKMQIVIPLIPLSASFGLDLQHVSSSICGGGRHEMCTDGDTAN